ncbi:MAG: IS1595 family transposase, partial [Gammaproteobacteria bacterium]
SAERLTAFIQKSIREGSLLITDGWSGYTGLENLGYGHAIRNIRRSGLPAHELLPRVHRVASLLKRWFLGTLQGGVQHRHLDYYLDEFTFRFNRRFSQSRGLLFYRLMQQAATCGSTPYHGLVGGRSRANHNIWN